jgi:proton glutamate symport protein
MAVRRIFNLALHWQILIGLLLGAGVGLTLNMVFGMPQVEFADGPRQVRISEDVGGITVSIREPGEQPREISARDADALRARYSAQFELYRDHPPQPTVASTVAAGSKWIGDMFLRLLRMITVPLILCSLVTGVAGLGSAQRLGRMFARTLTYYIVTSLLAITVGILFVNLIRPGVGAQGLPGGEEEVDVAIAEESLGSVFQKLAERMIPENPVEALADAEFLSIITFALLVGLFIVVVGGQSGETLRRLFEAGFDVIMAMTTFIIRLAPIGVLAYMLYATAGQGFGVFASLAKYMLTVFLALFVHACVTLPLILWFVARRSPWQFARAMSPALMTAFSTASSNGTLPLTLTSVEQRAGVSNRVSSFVLPLGAPINMDGTALYEAVAVLFIAQATPGVHLSLASQIIVAVTALLASIGAAGIPHAGLVMMAIVLQAVGLPTEAQGLIIAVDRVLDMCRTTVNVWSDSTGSAVIARFEGNESSAPET